MTVCIAAQCLYDEKPCFVLCTDSRIGDEYCSGDVSLKIRTPNVNWFYLTAGSVGRSQELVDILRVQAGGDIESDAEAIDAFRVAARMMKQRLVGEYLSTKWAMSLEEFRTVGPSHFPADVYSRVHSDIEQMGIGCETAIAGFAGRLPVMCLINQSGEVTPYGGFVTAGTGYLLAQASLYQRNYRWWWPIERAMYCVYEAKRLAERATGVGPTTNMAIAGPIREDDGDDIAIAGVQFVYAPGMAELESQFKTYGPQGLDSIPKFQADKMFSPT